MLNTKVYLPGDTILISDIGSQPDNYSDPGSTLVCVTTNVNKECCNESDYFSDAFFEESVGAWYYPDSREVSSFIDNTVDFEIVAYTEQLRLARVNTSTVAPLGIYTCQIPQWLSGKYAYANITLIKSGKMYVCVAL